MSCVVWQLEILYPDNGQVLDDTNLDIQIRVTGYDVPSVFHDSKICVALSAAGDHGYSEHCFDQTPDLVFHAKGLGAGAGYTLRIVFYERGKAIAMSVRSFRVAGASVAASHLVPSVPFHLTRICVLAVGRHQGRVPGRCGRRHDPRHHTDCPADRSTGTLPPLCLRKCSLS